MDKIPEEKIIKMPDVGLIAVHVRQDAHKFLIDMGYLIFTIPAYENWVTDKEIHEDAIKFLTTGKSKFIERSGKSDWKLSGCPLPDGKWRFLYTTTELAKESDQTTSEEIWRNILTNGGNEKFTYAILKNAKNNL